MTASPSSREERPLGRVSKDQPQARLLDALKPHSALRDAAAGTFAYEATTFDSAQANWPNCRLLPGQPPGPVSCAVAWCHGAPGIVRSRLFAESCGGFEVAAEIEAGLGSAARYAGQWYRAAGADFTACHGMFGLVDTLLDAVRSARGAHAPLLAEIVAYATERFHRGERAWPSGLLPHEEISGLMLGNAGIGHVYLRLGDPALGSVLAPAPQHKTARAGNAVAAPASKPLKALGN